ncbi:hypothetical protein [Paenibacillus sp. 7516]|uniref:hypothetical protein n=1 Tax=Paenibacillus sp. 7516 TaxID=2022549 RepID=UPI000BA5ED7D|nr:hypothetical protein [Paenibacillus sp. 7516]PAF31263.1 hypothetical protein CHI14_12105 [Paenibacillus sp. 7516]
MSGRILVELHDLMQAEKDLTHLMNLLKANKAHVQSIGDSVGDWRGQAAEELRSKMDHFLTVLTRRIAEFEHQQMDLARYTYRMEQADREG